MSRKEDLGLLEQAARLGSKRKDERSFWVGALGLRADGAFVSSYNGAARDKCAMIHAETRLCSKLDVGAIVWVARASRNGDLAMAKPCHNCERMLRRRGVRKVVYSTGPDSFEVLQLN